MDGFIHRHARKLIAQANALLASGYDYWYESTPPSGDGWEKNKTDKGEIHLQKEKGQWTVRTIRRPTRTESSR